MPPGVTEQDIRATLYHVRDACMAIVWYSFRLYQPQDRQRLVIRHVGGAGGASGGGRVHSVDRITQEGEDDVLGMLRTLSDFIAFNIGTLSHLDEIKTSAHNLINEAFTELTKQMNATEVRFFPPLSS
jgi:hypothetical protein